MSKKVEKTVPELRFPDFEGDWEEKSLQEISINGFSNGVFNDPQKVGTGYRLINVKDMYSGESIAVDSLTRLELDEKEFLNNQAKYGDIFFTRSSLVKEGIAHSNVLLSKAEDITYDGHLIKFSPDQDNYFPQFLALALKTDFLRSQLVARGKTGTMTTIGQDDVATVKMFCPSIAEQEKIAVFLGAVNIHLNQLCRKRELLQTYKRGVIQKLFSQPPQIRFKQPDGSPFPSWKEIKLGEVLDFKNGINADKAKYGYGKKFINVLDIINDAPIHHDSIIGSVEITEQEFENNDVRYGDVLFQRSSEIREEAGQSNIYLDRDKKATFGGFVIRGRPKISFNPVYFHNLLKTKAIRKEITDRSGGSTRFNIGQDSLREVPIVMCTSIEEQAKIADFLTAIDQKIKAIFYQIDCTERFKRGLRQKMFV